MAPRIKNNRRVSGEYCVSAKYIADATMPTKVTTCDIDGWGEGVKIVQAKCIVTAQKGSHPLRTKEYVTWSTREIVHLHEEWYGVRANMILQVMFGSAGSNVAM